ncbi:unnamed protein product [Phaedon cochleariae]|uniref:SAM domain-containing protein n=1 Tax=Phaedon cochleariae TaxID=80249 RepID=A0A9P0DK22_PHACE|nr:unnamed protein product [Phaedon cochleariae]
MSTSSAANSDYIYDSAAIVLNLDQSQDGEDRIYTLIGETTDSMAVAASDDDVAGYLRGWGLANYIETFRTNDVTLHSLPFLKDDMVRELIPSIGHRAQFLSHWEKWKASMHSAPTYLPIPNMEPSKSMENTDATENHVTSERTSELMHHDSSHQDTRNALLKLLNETNDGKALLAEETTRGCLSSKGRSTLCKLIIRRELQGDPTKRISGDRLLAISFEIKEVFRREHASTYYIPYQSYGVGLKSSAKGKLINCLDNLRREYRKSGLIAKSSRYSTPSPSRTESPVCLSSARQLRDRLAGLPEEDADEQILWLQNSSDPWQMVEVFWSLTTKARLQSLSSEEMTITEYFSKFPCLHKPSGYLLLLTDFSNIFPDHTEALNKTFPLTRERLLNTIKKRIDSSSVPDMKANLKELLKLAEGGEEHCNIALFLSIAYLLNLSSVRRSKKSTTWRPSRLESMEGFITHVRSAAEVEETINRRRDKMAGLKLHLQPFIIIVGQTLSDISSYYIIVDKTLYKVENILSAVDACFKIIHVLNAEYPTESKPIWMFIQLCFFEMSTKYDQTYTTVSTLLSELEVREQERDK